MAGTGSVVGCSATGGFSTGAGFGATGLGADFLVPACAGLVGAATEGAGVVGGTAASAAVSFSFAFSATGVFAGIFAAWCFLDGGAAFEGFTAEGCAGSDTGASDVAGAEDDGSGAGAAAAGAGSGGGADGSEAVAACSAGAGAGVEAGAGAGATTAAGTGTGAGAATGSVGGSSKTVYSRSRRLLGPRTSSTKLRTGSSAACELVTTICGCEPAVSIRKLSDDRKSDRSMPAR